VGFQIAYIVWPKQDKLFKKCNTMQKRIRFEVRKLDFINVLKVYIKVENGNTIKPKEE